MKKKEKPRRLRWLVGALCVFLLAAVCVPVVGVIRDSGKGIQRPERAEADTAFRGWVTVPEGDVIARADIPQGGQSLSMQQEQVFTVTVPQAGEYAIALGYTLPKAAVLDSTVTLTQLTAAGEPEL